MRQDEDEQFEELVWGCPDKLPQNIWISKCGVLAFVIKRMCSKRLGDSDIFRFSAYPPECGK